FGVGQTERSREIQNVKTKRTQVGGWSQMRYQRHTENYHLHHAKEVVDALDRIVREEQIEEIVLAGNETGVIPILRDQLPPHLSAKVIDVLKLGIDTPEQQLLEAATEAYRAHEATADPEKVRPPLDEYRADGLAVVGVPDTLA